MFQIPEYNEILSKRMSKVLEDIGVVERIVLKKRRAVLLVEALENERVQLENIMATDTNERKQIKAKFQMYYLGSQSEGTTTFGLKSDSDQLLCFQTFNAIQDWDEWEPYLPTYLMIQDENVSPGYCLLQRLRGDAPVPADTVSDEHHFKDSLGRILLKNNVVNGDAPKHLGGVINGPAFTAERQHVDTDNVVAFLCKSWPLKARFQQQDEHWWPSESMRRYFTSTGCFVVGVGRKGSEYEQFEWRISTSLAERCLIFNLNITQIRCYILMKMILKTFIKPNFKETISSYMCKTVLLHCISNTHFNLWKERNLYFCLLLNLAVLYNYIRNESCPQFFIPENNLMRGKISPEVKPFLLSTLLDVIDIDKSALFKISCDGFGSRLYLMSFDLRPLNANSLFSGSLLQTIAKKLNIYMIFIRRFIKKNHRVSLQILTNPLLNLVKRFNHSQGFRRAACSLITPWVCTTIGSILASRNIQDQNAISAGALTWISLGLNTDVASSKLKLASMLYCTGEFHRAEIVLREIERKYDLNNVETICGCYYSYTKFKEGFLEVADNYSEDVLRNITASCVCFMQCEINCVPKELRYEMFRSTQEDIAFRGIDDDLWMDFAVVDSLTYLYFLQYKTFSYLGKQFNKQTALSNLSRTINQEPSLRHRETALNLLGQCMEKEGQVRNALQCYQQSLHLRGRNNAANLHLCILLNTMVNDRQ